MFKFKGRECFPTCGRAARLNVRDEVRAAVTFISSDFFFFFKLQSILDIWKFEFNADVFFVFLAFPLHCRDKLSVLS